MIAIPTLISLALTPWPRSFSFASAAVALPATPTASESTTSAANRTFHFDGRLTPEPAICSPPGTWLGQRVRRPRTFVSPPTCIAVSRFGSPEPGNRVGMYIGLGTLVVILIIVLIIYFVRRA